MPVSANRQGDIGSGCRSSKSGVFLQPLDHHQTMFFLMPVVF
ncbi:hypothetical protein T10_11222 [Trichinella papuae]|uniref:Uncharacterized protein n=1 Tax=Trichinella papuae TaxID=268474 RepID=A0A0V1LWY4_9BILA|nr:hypothetical protein T10_11222 [Trichinella papuae]